MLPELDGRAVIRAVRRDDEAAATPIIILSARGATIDRIAGLEDGADDYLPKPFSPAELVLRVKSILRAGRPPRRRDAAATGPARADRPWRPGPRPRPPRGPARRRPVAADARRVPAARDAPRGGRAGADPRPAARRGLRHRTGRRSSTGRSTSTSAGCATSSATTRTRPRYVATVRGVGYRAAPRIDRAR